MWIRVRIMGGLFDPDPCGASLDPDSNASMRIRITLHKISYTGAQWGGAQHWSLPRFRPSGPAEALAWRKSRFLSRQCPEDGQAWRKSCSRWCPAAVTLGYQPSLVGGGWWGSLTDGCCWQQLSAADVGTCWYPVLLLQLLLLLLLLVVVVGMLPSGQKSEFMHRKIEKKITIILFEKDLFQKFLFWIFAIALYFRIKNRMYPLCLGQNSNWLSIGQVRIS